jgi:HEPN domain-containing protein
MLYEAGRYDLANIIGSIVSSYREGLELLEESCIEGRYGEFEYLENQGRVCLEVAKKVFEVLARVESELAGTSN